MKIVKADVVELPTWAYRAIRSFVESSTKPDYPWNTGVLVNDKVVFYKRGKWVLEISRDGSIIRAELLDYSGRLVVAYESGLVHFPCRVLRDCEEGEDHGSYPEDFATLFFTAKVPYARPINLTEISAKMELYVNAVRKHLTSTPQTQA